jgi:hypothetical protein
MAAQANSNLVTLADSLSNVLSGTLIVSVNNFPFLKIDGESKNFDIEIKGLKESGIQTSKLAGDSSQGFLDTFKMAEKIAKGLHEKGWRLRVFDEGSSLVSMGRDVSPLTGFVWGNPLKLLKILRST